MPTGSIRSGAQKRGLNWRCQFDVYGLLGGNQSLLNKITYAHCEEKKPQEPSFEKLIEEEELPKEAEKELPEW